MGAVVRVSVRFLEPTEYPAFNGRSEGGASEWPPSPLRLFQALVAGAAARFGTPAELGDSVGEAFGWLAAQPAPTIVCPLREFGSGYRIAVPNNDSDVIARRLAKGLVPDKQPSELKTLKPVRPVRLLGEEYPFVHYLWPVADGGHGPHLGTLAAAARSVTHLGWGIDMVAADAAVLTPEQADALTGERWRPAEGGGGTPLRVPRAGTLDTLRQRHQAFLGRLPEGGGFVPVPPLTAFDVKGYRRDTDPVPRAVAAFELRTPDLIRFQPYDTPTRTAAVAGMVRNATFELAKQTEPFGWSKDDRLAAVHGHTPDGSDRLRGPGADERFLFLPLPSVERRPGGGEVVGGVRRVLVVAPPGKPAAARWAKGLSGVELSPLQGTRPAALRVIDPPESDWVVGRYLGPARVWTTVTPVLRPGFDDRDPEKAKALLRKAFVQAGFPPGLVKAAGLEWRAVGFRAGVDHVRRYRPPEGLDGYPRFHVRVTWPAPVSGPIAVGAGRYRGFGVFVADLV